MSRSPTTSSTPSTRSSRPARRSTRPTTGGSRRRSPTLPAAGVPDVGEVPRVASHLAQQPEELLDAVAVHAEITEDLGVHGTGGRARPGTSLFGELCERAAAVGGVGHPRDEALLFEAVDRVGHARGVDLEALTDLAEGKRAAGGEREEQIG